MTCTCSSYRWDRLQIALAVHLACAECWLPACMMCNTSACCGLLLFSRWPAECLAAGTHDLFLLQPGASMDRLAAGALDGHLCLLPRTACHAATVTACHPATCR